MNEVEIYNLIRSEILLNHLLMHVTTLVVVILLLGGIWLAESKRSIISVFLPLLSLAWAAAIVRFDFFIHCQATYLRVVERRLQESGISIPMWETWKSSLRSTGIVVPFSDLIAILIIVIPTIYLLFGPAQNFFVEKQWSRRRVYAWGVLIALVLMLGCLPFIPKIAQQ
jgi:hypothetical protein